MEIEKTFRSFFITQPALATVFGESFHWDRVPDTPKYPCVRATVISNTFLRTHSKKTGSGMVDIQLDVFHPEASTCSESANLIIDTLDEYTGAIGDFPTCLILSKGAKSLPEPESRSFRKIIEMRVCYA